MKTWRIGLLVTLITGGTAALLLTPLPLRITNQVISRIDIDRAPDDVYRYVSTPAWWPRWHPSSLAVSGDAGHSLVQGERVTEQFSVAGRRGTANWLVTEREPGQQWSIVGEIGGRVAGRVTYRVAPRDGGTRFERQFEYYAPNLLFVLLDQVKIHAMVKAESQQAVENLARVMQVAPSADATGRQP